MIMSLSFFKRYPSRLYRGEKVLDLPSSQLSLNIVCLFIGIVGVVFAPAGFAGDDDDTDRVITIEKHIQTFTVNPDGSYVQVKEDKRLIVQERGIKSAAQQYFPYNSVLDNMEILEAYTQKADGRKIAVTPEQIKTQQEPRSFAAPMFQDVRYKVVIFPEVAVGDRVYVKVKRTQHTSLFPGQFQDFTLPAFFLYEEFRLIYDVPAEIKLYADSVGFKEVAPIEKDGRRIYEWTYLSKRTKKRIESDSVAYSDYGDRIAVSTFADYGEFAKAFDARAADKAVASPKIRELAQKLVQGVDDPKGKTKVLYDWVRKNIRYVAVYIGAGGVVPHAADTILDNRYGDCKDHVTLLEALLSAVGIESTPALINKDNAYQLPTVPSLWLLNHAITYIPSLDMFLDSTAEALEFGYLSLVELDKPVLLSKTGKLMRTPLRQIPQLSTRLQFNIEPDGSAAFILNERIQGGLAGPTRFMIHNMKPSDRGQAVRRMLQRVGLEGSGTMKVSDSNDTEGAYEYSASGKIENLVNFPGPVGLSTITGFGGSISTIVANFTKEQERVQPFTCVSQQVEAEAAFAYPAQTSIVSLPKGINIKSDFFDYQSQYTQVDEKIIVKRLYQSHFPSSVCKPEDFKKIKPELSQMMSDLRSQIIIRRQ